MDMADAPKTAEEPSDYSLGYGAGLGNMGVWGGESEEWLRGFADGTEDRIKSEIDGAENDR
jgi:hypothetical protein